MNKLYHPSGIITTYSAIASSTWTLWLLVQVTGGRKFWLAEPNTWILNIELIGMSLIILNAIIFSIWTIKRFYIKEVK